MAQAAGDAAAFSRLAEFDVFLRSYEEKTKTKFIVCKSDRQFGKSELRLTGKAVHWQLRTVPFDGTPFVVLGSKTFICHQGRDKHAAAKRKREESMAKCHNEEHVFAETRQLMQTTKKTGCPATINAVHICRFPDYKINENTAYQRREKSSAVRKALRGDPSLVGTEQMFAAYFPHVTEHKNHPVVGKVAEMREPIDASVKKHIETLTLAGLHEVQKVRQHLNSYVQEIFQDRDPPSPSRRRFYPLDKDIRNIMQKVKTDSRKSRMDQLNIQDPVESWRQQGCAVEYRPSQKSDDGAVEKLLLCLQTSWQRRLLVLYGQQLCLLDAAYRRSRYSVPLFFLCVRTNVNYIVVGVFVTQSETKEDISEALEVFKKWNAGWKPTHFMADFCEAEIGALEEVFTYSKVVLCDFLRERAWIEWTRKKSHGVMSQEEVLKMLQAIADSRTLEEYENRTLLLKQHAAWQTNEMLRRWFSTKWLCQAERWVTAFKKEDLRVAIYANNGVERLNEMLRHSHLKGYKDCTLTDTITAVVQDFLPISYQRYIELNAKCSSGYRVYSQNVPSYLRDKPRIVAEHILTRHQESQVFTEGQVTPAGEASFRVGGQVTPQLQSTVCFGSGSQMPSCTCKDWQKNLLPCKHFCAVFNLVPGWSWDSLCLSYRENPLFMLDEVCLGHSGTEPSDSEQQTHSGSPQSSSSSTVLTGPSTKAQKRQKCGSLLKELADKVYHLQDERYMDRVIEKLEDLLEEVGQHTPHDGPLDLSYAPPIKRRCSGAAERLRPLKKDKQKQLSRDGGTEMASNMHKLMNL